MKILINGTDFTVNGSVFSPFWSDLNSGSWERETFEVIDYFVTEGTNTMDIGPEHQHMPRRATRMGNTISILKSTPSPIFSTTPAASSPIPLGIGSL